MTAFIESADLDSDDDQDVEGVLDMPASSVYFKESPPRDLELRNILDDALSIPTVSFNGHCRRWSQRWMVIVTTINFQR